MDNDDWSWIGVAGLNEWAAINFAIDEAAIDAFRKEERMAKEWAGKKENSPI